MLQAPRAGLLLAPALVVIAASLARGGPAGPGGGLARGSNQFAFELHRVLRAQPGNLAFSPASISIALAMTWSGARGTTAAQMGKVLHLQGAPGTVMPEAGALLKALNDPARTSYTLRVANRLFVEKTYPLLPAYLAQVAAFDAPAEPTDFRHAPEPARQHINQWVARQTADRIRDLLAPNSINDQTRLALVNALYLLADWLKPFAHERTQPRPFHAPAGAHDVPTMLQVETFDYAEAPGLQLLEMRYRGEELAMDVLLPATPTGLDALEKDIDATRLAGWLAALKPERLFVSLPRFTIDPAGPIVLSDALQALGMTEAFDRERADFTALANPPSPADRLVISQVFHKAFVKVDEKGTEAAAATAVVMARAGSAAPARPKEFVADHPFLFVIRDLRSGLILFLGRVTDPA